MHVATQGDKMETNVVTQTVGNMLEVINEHRTKVLVVIASLVIGVAGFFGYRFYRNGVQTAAHQSFMEAMKHYERPVKVDAKTKDGFESEQAKWEAVETAFRLGYEKNKSSTLAPMFLAFQATALVNLNKQQEAIVAMKNAVKGMNSLPLRSYYEITLSLMQLDTTDKAAQEEGLVRLRTIAYDATHLAQAQALYHLGLLAWTEKKFDDVKNYWQQFMVKFGELPGYEYQTAAVKEKLDLLVV